MVSKTINQKLKYVGLFAILPLMMVALAPELLEEAHAQKAQGSPGHQSPKSYGSSTEDIVCGASLCSETKDNSASIKASS